MSISRKSHRNFRSESLITIRSVPMHFRRCGRGILKGAAFRQRPLSRLLLKVLAETRTLPPEGPALKYLWREGKKHFLLFWADEGIGPYEFYYGSRKNRGHLVSIQAGST